MSPRTKSIVGAIGTLLLVIVVAWWSSGSSGDEAPAATRSVSVEDSTELGESESPPSAGELAESTAPIGETNDERGAAAWQVCVPDGYPTVTLGELPDQAIEVLELIDDGGPFPYRQDDSVFQNREGELPDHERGYYREYTVETPGSPDRGPRRIVAGECGERFYTADHYDSFELIEEGS
ncbi:MAG: ribonuclease domain-containing protein [Ilumatobacteraceae bacterium]